MVTPGFNADFDGDTMAVFLPPYEHAQDLSRYSVLSNPGIIGDGKPALAASLDLALGWHNMNPNSSVKLSLHLAELLRTIPAERMREELRRLQFEVAENSSGAATLTPVEFERLSGDDDSCGYGLTSIVNSGAKGSPDDVAKMVKELGNIDKMNDDDESAKDTKSVHISGNFWHGLNDEELFTYSYPSRYSMAQKKLSVADAGYLSRLLAEKLFNYTVSIDDCGTLDGVKVSYSPEADRLIVDGEILPTMGDLRADAERLLWGRVLVGENTCLDSEAVRKILEALTAGSTVVVRSPIHCKERVHGQVCASCYGADVASKPYDKPEKVQHGFSAGLTAAEAIGERGTQLTMKRFHQVGTSKESPIGKIRRLLLSSENTRISDVIAEILRSTIQEDEGRHKANKELPQAMIHFEAALSCGNAGDDEYISALSGENISRLLIQKNGTDSLTTVKSRILWEGGEIYDGTSEHA